MKNRNPDERTLLQSIKDRGLDLSAEGIEVKNGNALVKKLAPGVMKAIRDLVNNAERKQMKNRTWNPEMTDAETKELAYYERNMLALRYADGWYYDTDNDWSGWKRVLSLDGGKMTFHIPDSFNVGTLKQIEPNYDGHTTEEKWSRIDRLFSINQEEFV